MREEDTLVLVRILVGIVVIWLVVRVLRRTISSGVAGGIRRANEQPPHLPPLTSGFPVVPTQPTPAAVSCENCGAAIGALETPHVWKNHTVCAACHRKLSGTS